MQEPNPKDVPVYVPELAGSAFSLAISHMYEGRVFDDLLADANTVGAGTV